MPNLAMSTKRYTMWCLCVFRCFFKLHFHEVTFFWCNPAVRQMDNDPTENSHQFNLGFQRKSATKKRNSCLKNVALMQVFSNQGLIAVKCQYIFMNLYLCLYCIISNVSKPNSSREESRVLSCLCVIVPSDG